MLDFIYSTLSKIGYTHPLHPAITHLPVGLVFGAFLFSLAGRLFGRSSLMETARNCMILALIVLLPAVFLGLMDWQHFYAGAWIFPIKMKIVLACILLILFLFNVFLFIKDKNSTKILIIYSLCFVTVVGLGFFGGELVFGKRTPIPDISNKLVMKGAEVFEQNCSMCHYSDKTDTRVGPGLRGLFRKEKLLRSGWSMSESNIRKQIKTPFDNMPPFDKLSEDQVESLIAYLKTL